MKASQEFVVGKHNIGYVSSDFKSAFSDQEFNANPLGKFQKLGRYMTDAQIESELKPGICGLGDIFAFLENAPEECKDGNWNLFYFPAFVVHVRWFGGAWGVSTWYRGGRGWRAEGRAFSPATVASGSSVSESSNLESLDLEKAIEVVKKAGYRVFLEK